MPMSENGCTTEELVAYLYNELPLERLLEISDQLEQNWPLHEKLEVLREASSRLDKQSFFSPREQTISSIMTYAQKNMPSQIEAQ